MMNGLLKICLIYPFLSRINWAFNFWHVRLFPERRKERRRCRLTTNRPQKEEENFFFCFSFSLLKHKVDQSFLEIGFSFLPLLCSFQRHSMSAVLLVTHPSDKHNTYLLIVALLPHIVFQEWLPWTMKCNFQIQTQPSFPKRERGQSSLPLCHPSVHPVKNHLSSKDLHLISISKDIQYGLKLIIQII